MVDFIQSSPVFPPEVQGGTGISGNLQGMHFYPEIADKREQKFTLLRNIQVSFWKLPDACSGFHQASNPLYWLQQTSQKRQLVKARNSFQMLLKDHSETRGSRVGCQPGTEKTSRGSQEETRMLPK